MRKEREQLNIQNTPRDSDSKRLGSVTIYHPILPRIHQLVRKHWPLLKQVYTMVEEFQTPSLICYKQSSNIHDKLIRGDIGSLTQIPHRFCGHNNMGLFPVWDVGNVPV